MHLCGQSSKAACGTKNARQLCWPRPAAEKDEECALVESNEDEQGVAIDIRSFNTTAYKSIDIMIGIVKIKDMQNPLRVVDLAHAAKVDVSFRHHGVDYSRRLLFITTLQPASELFEAVNNQDCN